MSETTGAVMALALDRGGNQSLQLQLYDQLRGLILAGRLGPGAVLPSSRALAGELGVSRTTVLLAYDQLAPTYDSDGRGVGVSQGAARCPSPRTRRGCLGRGCAERRGDGSDLRSDVGQDATSDAGAHAAGYLGGVSIG